MVEQCQEDPKIPVKRCIINFDVKKSFIQLLVFSVFDTFTIHSWTDIVQKLLMAFLDSWISLRDLWIHPWLYFKWQSWIFPKVSSYFCFLFCFFFFVFCVFFFLGGDVWVLNEPKIVPEWVFSKIIYEKSIYGICLIFALSYSNNCLKINFNSCFATKMYRVIFLIGKTMYILKVYSIYNTLW